MYTAPYQFEPLLPSDSRMEPLLAGTRVPPELRALLRSMNSYYTNRMEGQYTRPREIDEALRIDFSTDAKLAAKQCLAVTHIEAEQALEQHYAGEEGARALHSTDAAQTMHQELFGSLPAEGLLTYEGYSPSFRGNCASVRCRLASMWHRPLPACISFWSAGKVTTATCAGARPRW